MREKKAYTVVTFATTAAAIAMERACARAGLSGRLIPVPRELTADCGMAWRSPIGESEALRALAAAERLETDGWHELQL